jgi:hypothetical protein
MVVGGVGRGGDIGDERLVDAPDANASCTAMTPSRMMSPTTMSSSPDGQMTPSGPWKTKTQPSGSPAPTASRAVRSGAEGARKKSGSSVACPSLVAKTTRASCGVTDWTVSVDFGLERSRRRMRERAKASSSTASTARGTPTTTPRVESVVLCADSSSSVVVVVVVVVGRVVVVVRRLEDEAAEVVRVVAGALEGMVALVMGGGVGAALVVGAGGAMVVAGCSSNTAATPPSAKLHRKKRGELLVGSTKRALEQFHVAVAVDAEQQRRAEAGAEEEMGSTTVMVPTTPKTEMAAMEDAGARVSGPAMAGSGGAATVSAMQAATHVGKVHATDAVTLRKAAVGAQVGCVELVIATVGSTTLS